MFDIRDAEEVLKNTLHRFDENGLVVSRDHLLGSLHLHHQPRMTFKQTNLISDGSVSAEHSDPHLINPWGVAFSPTGPFWVSDAGIGVTTIYDSKGAPFPVAGHHT